MYTSKFVASARRTLEIETKEIKALSKKLDANFDKACRLIKNCKGRVITLGIGKSGHIANKISATFSSTGSPSFFINAAEAKHGDLGAISKDDVVLVLSYSGESEEITSILPNIKELGCSIISMTGNIHSTLAKASKVNLIIDINKEACPLDLAPTASTTVALSLGDALAVAIFESKKLNSQDFARSHPGGLLGKRLTLKVKDLMHLKKDLPLVKPDTLLSKALIEISKKNLGLAIIVDKKENLIGIFTDGDLRRALNKKIDIHSTKISSVMSPRGKTIQDTLLAVDAIKLMEINKIYSLVVLNKKRICGIISMHDFLKAGLL